MAKKPTRTLCNKVALKLKGVIFDLDGVVVNTVPLHFKAWKKMFAEYGKKFTLQDYLMKVDGIPRFWGAKAILFDLPKAELEKAAARKQNYFLGFLRTEGVKVYQDTVSLINRLKNNNLRVAVISSSKNCLDILKKAKLVNLFEVIITGNDVKKGKPYPDVFLLAAKKLDLKPRECIVFEDAVLGIEAAKRAKMKSVGVDRHHNPQKLKQADLVTNNLRQISISELRSLISK